MFPESHNLTRLQLGSLSDEVLLAYAQCGYQDALAVIVNRYQRLVRSVAATIVHDPAEAEDVTQVVFLDLFRKIGLFNENRGSLRTWVLQIAHSRSVNWWYQLSRRQFYDHDDIEDVEEASWSRPASTVLGLTRCEAVHLVQEVLETLPKAQRTTIELIHFEDLTFEEAAVRMGQTLNATKHRYYRGILKLRHLISVDSGPHARKPAPKLCPSARMHQKGKEKGKEVRAFLKFSNVGPYATKTVAHIA